MILCRGPVIATVRRNLGIQWNVRRAARLGSTGDLAGNAKTPTVVLSHRPNARLGEFCHEWHQWTRMMEERIESIRGHS
jgi:hypothetical protein